MLYYYKATVLSVYDGDTMTVTIDLGFGVQVAKAKLRLYGVNTPEMRGGTKETKAKAVEARDYVRKLCEGDVYIHSAKKGKYGRFISTVWTMDEDGKRAEKSVNELLIENDLAIPYMV